MIELTKNGVDGFKLFLIQKSDIYPMKHIKANPSGNMKISKYVFVTYIPTNNELKVKNLGEIFENDK